MNPALISITTANTSMYFHQPTTSPNILLLLILKPAQFFSDPGVGVISGGGCYGDPLPVQPPEQAHPRLVQGFLGG